MVDKDNSSIREDKNKSDKMVPVSGLPISTRLRNGLRRNGIEYLQQVENYSEHKILRIRNIGRGTLQELKDVCNQYGVHIYNYDDLKDTGLEPYLTPDFYDKLFAVGIRTKEELINTEDEKLAEIYGANSIYTKRLLQAKKCCKNKGL